MTPSQDVIDAIIEEMTARCTLTNQERAACIYRAVVERVRPFQTDGGKMSTKFIVLPHGDFIRLDLLAGAQYLPPYDDDDFHKVIITQVAIKDGGSVGANYFGQYKFSSEQECRDEIRRILEAIK